MIVRIFAAAVAVAMSASACASGVPEGPKAAWSEGAPLPTPRTEVAVAAVDGTIFVAGGFTEDGKVADDVDEYDAEHDSWGPGERLPTPLHHAALAAADHRVWIIGGYLEDGTASPGVWSWQRNDLTWRDEPSLPTARGAHAVAVAGDEIHVFGGADRFGPGSNLVTEHAVFDISERVWTIRADLPTARDHLAAASVGSGASPALAVVGGRRLSVDENLGSLELFDPKRKQWSRSEALPTPRGGLAAAALGRRLFVFGGEQASGTFDQTEIYDTRTRSWSTGPAMPTPRHGLGAAVVDGKIYVIGGGREPGLSVTSANEILSLEE